jgi:PAS domain S-box-containing protein
MSHTSAGIKDGDEPRVRVTYVYALLAFASLFVFGSLQILVEGAPRLGYLEIGGSLAILITAGGLKRTHNITLASNLILLSILTMLVVMLLTGGTADTGLFWVFLFPVSSFFLTNKKAGLWWMLALFILIGLIMVGSYYGEVASPYSLITLRQLLVTLGVVTIGIYAYQQSRESMAREAQKSSVTSKEDRIKADIIIDNIGEGVVAVDVKGRIILVNKVAADMIGWKIDELQNKTYVEAIPMVDASGQRVTISERPLMRTLQGGEEVRLDTSYLRKDGSAFAVEVTSKPIVVDGKVHGAIATFRDTTAEHAIDRTKSEFVTLASHQLRTPISAISWVAELLLHGDAGKLKPEQAEYVQQVYQSSKRMATLVDSMLTASSLELGSLSVQPKRIDLAKISRGVIKQQFDTLSTNKILHVKEQYDPDLPNPVFDAGIVKTILQNLVSNSFKYTQNNGTVTVTIKVNDDDIVLEVSDTGVGIPLRQQPKIFTRLFRAENVKRQDTDGTGLGLYIVKMMAEYVGGRITFTSEEHKGSTFTVYLPLEGIPTKHSTKAKIA